MNGILSILFATIIFGFLISINLTSCQSEFKGPNRSPIAIAGPDQIVELGKTVSLDGGNSYDPDGDEVDYFWQLLSVPHHSNTTIFQEGTKAIFRVDHQGIYIVGLVVTDKQEAQSAIDVVLLRTRNTNCTTDSDCDDQEDCTRDSCVEGECIIQALTDGATCDDQRFCTVDDRCSNGACQGAQRLCEALADTCNQAECNESENNCQKKPKADQTPCEDGLYCTVNEQCIAGQCASITARDCSVVSRKCVDGICDEQTDRCIGDPVPAGRICDDGLYCTIDDQCDGNGACHGTERTCEHLNQECSQGWCDEKTTKCIALPAGNDTDQDGVCDVLDQCTGNDATGDTDGDRTCNDQDSDDDNDGYLDLDELTCGSDPLLTSSIPTDADSDRVCDLLDVCSGDDVSGDTDFDGTCNDQDPDDDDDGYLDGYETACGSDPLMADSLPVDADKDGVCEPLDVCIGDNATGDNDGDNVCDNLDLCKGNDSSGDSDQDGVCDSDDSCPGLDDGIDTDLDGFPDCVDQCQNDPYKTLAGICGCGNSDQDADNNGTIDCLADILGPNALGGLCLWLDANSGVINADNTPANDAETVKDWLNQVSDRAQFNATQPIATNRPIYRTNAANGLPMIFFDGDTDTPKYLRSGDLDYGPGNAISVFVAYKTEPDARQQGSDSTGYLFAKDRFQSSAPYLLQLTGNGLQCSVCTSEMTDVVNAGTNDGQVHIATLVFDGSLLKCYFDSEHEAVVEQNPIENDTPLAIGSNVHKPSYRPFGGYLAELLFYDRALSAVERIRVEIYLKTKYAIGYGP